MIPENAITEWRSTVPWNNPEQVEQDLLICRSLVEIFKDNYLSSRLAFRGGTALHKLYVNPQARYSEDIDLVQIKAEPIKKTLDALRDVLAFLGEPVILRPNEIFDFDEACLFVKNKLIDKLRI